MLVQIRHDSSCKKQFDVYFGEKKLRSGEEYDLPQEQLCLRCVERNPLMGHFWFFRLFAMFVAGIISGNFSDLREIPRERTEIEIHLSGAGEDIEITLSENGCTVFGAERAEESRRTVPLPRAERRVRTYRAAILALGLAALAGAVVWLILSVF